MEKKQLKRIAHVTEEQYQEVMDNGSIVIDGVVKRKEDYEFVTNDTTLEQANAYTDQEVQKVKLYKHHLELTNNAQDPDYLYCTIYDNNPNTYNFSSVTDADTLGFISQLFIGEIVFLKKVIRDEVLHYVGRVNDSQTLSPDYALEIDCVSNSGATIAYFGDGEEPLYGFTLREI